jgi:hypothetical protein
MPPARPVRGRIALGVVTAFVVLLALSGMALVVSAGDATGRAFGAVELAMGLLILSLLVPMWRGPRPPGPGSGLRPPGPTPGPPAGPPTPGPPPGPPADPTPGPPAGPSA